MKRILWALGLLILGAGAGAALLFPAAAARLERSQLQAAQQQAEIHRLRNEADRLREKLLSLSRGQGRGNVVEGVRVEISYPDSLIRLKLAEAVRPWVDGLVGRAVGSLDPFLLYHLLNDRRVPVDGKSYLLRTRVILVGTDVTCYLEATLAPAAP